MNDQLLAIPVMTPTVLPGKIREKTFHVCRKKDKPKHHDMQACYRML
jgi:hypothetical protein